MQAITLDLPRRGFMAGLCAAMAKAALTPVGATADGDTAPTYRSAIDLIQALAARQISARELLDATITRIEALDRKSTRSSCATSIGRASLPMPPTLRWGVASAARCSACP